MNFRRVMYRYQDGVRVIAYVTATEWDSLIVNQVTSLYTIGTLDVPNLVFPDDATAIAYFDAVVPLQMTSDYNTVTGESQTVGVIREYNSETVFDGIAQVSDDVADLSTEVSDIADELTDVANDVSGLVTALGSVVDYSGDIATLTTAVASKLSASDIQSGVTLADVATDLPTNISVVALLGAVVGNVNATNVRVNLLATRLNSLITALESKSILTP